MNNFKVVKMIDNETIEKRIKEIGEQITKDYEGEDIKMVIILKGSAPFACQLMKNINNDKLTIDFMCVSSYGNKTKSNGTVRINKDLDRSIEGENVIIIEDIVDSGYTLYKLKQMLSTRNPKSIRLCSLLDKPSRREVDIKTEYCGFEIEDKFVVGYGLDYDQMFRHLPYIGEVVFE